MGTHRWIGYLVWALLFGALFAWEGIGLVRTGSAYPTFSDVIRAVMRFPVARWALFALWLWFGWHAFIRGWHFLLRGPEGGGPPRGQGGPRGSSPSIIRRDVLPMALGYLLVMTTLAIGLRARGRYQRGASQKDQPRSQSAGQPGWPGLIRHAIGTAIGGYALLMAVILGYYYAVPGQSADFLASAFTGAAILVALALPLFLIASYLVERRRGPP